MTTDPKAEPKQLSPHLASLDDAIPEDEVRQHAQDPAEGADPDDTGDEDVPRVHAEDPAEG